MRILLILLTLSSTIAFSQNCDDLVKHNTIQKIHHKQGENGLFIGMSDIDPANSGDTDINYFVIEKTIEKTDTTYKLSISKGTLSMPDESNIKGVVLTFTDGSKFEKPNQKVKVKAGLGKYKLVTDCEVSKAELQEIGAKEISEVTLIKSTTGLQKGTAHSIKAIIPCLLLL